MKTVYNNTHDLIHAFAQCNKPHGKTRTGNVFFEGNILYSYGYHFELAKFINDETVILNDDRYSNSTSKQQAIVRSALRQYTQIFKSVWDIERVNKRLEHLKDKLLRAKKPEIYINDAISLIEKHIEAQNLHQDKSYAENGFNKFTEYVEFFKSNSNLDKLKERQEQLKLQEAKAFKEFENAFFSHLPYVEFMNKAKSSFDLIRISLDENYIETSQNVKIDINEAKKMYRALKSGVNIVGQYVGNFQYKIHANNGKMLKIGCHNIKLNHIHEIMGTT
jgi:hypothetical protein